jgi:hypothetical protein
MYVVEVLHEMVLSIETAVILTLGLTGSGIAHPYFMANVTRRHVSIQIESPAKGLVAELACELGRPSGTARRVFQRRAWLICNAEVPLRPRLGTL